MARTSGRFPRHRESFDHRNWLDLIDVSGPFLSLPVLRKHWPALDSLDKTVREQLRQKHTALPGREWLDYVLADLLEWGDALRTKGLDDLALEVPEHDETVTPSFALVEPGADVKPETARLLGVICDGQPTQRIKDSDWAATPVDRLVKLCRFHKVELGLATDGRWWALVVAPRSGGATTTVVFDAVDWATAAERDVVRAFVSMLRRSRFFAVPDEETLPHLLEESKDSQEDITEALGVQVRQAVELLVAAIGRFHTQDVKNDGAGIGDVSAHDVYRGAVAVMMRIVFLLFAEERGLLPSDKELYRESYSVGLLCAELEKRVLEGSEEDLEHTTGAWHRLLATFNAVYFGVDHPELQMHPHDGSIFDPYRYDWLPLAIDDRTVLHMLQAVQYVQIGTGKNRERRRLSFNTLDVEQIGYVYEGLLSYEGFYAEETVVGLIGKEGIEAEVTLRVLQDLLVAAGSLADFAAKLAGEYKDSKIGSAVALEKRLAPLPADEEEEAKRKLLAVTRGNYQLTLQLLPFYGIIRVDLRDQPVVILTDALYVTESSLRKNTGTHYTPKFLAEQVVEGALEPLMYSPGPLQSAERGEWRPRSSPEILNLKVADIAMGSAAFLVAACRYLAKHLVEAWIREKNPRAAAYRAAPEGASAADTDRDPVVIDARRCIIENCLYGVDINEMAVEMAKLSLWLISMDPHRPFTFLDDRLVVGDSLLGITALDQLEWMHMNPAAGRELHGSDSVEKGARLFDLTVGIREMVADITADRLRLTEIDGTTLEGLEKKRGVLAETETKSARARLIADLAVGATLAYAGKGKDPLNIASNQAVQAATELLTFTSGESRTDIGSEPGTHYDSTSQGGELAGRDQASLWLRTDLPSGGFERGPVHWPLAFPEVFEAARPNGPGFDAIIGNPPFLGGTKISGPMGVAYRKSLALNLVGYDTDRADLAAFFVRRASSLLDQGGTAGLVTTHAVTQGGSREIGFDYLISQGWSIYKAISRRPWPSRSAAVYYVASWLFHGEFGGPCKLDDSSVSAISGSLGPRSRVDGKPFLLARNLNKGLQGSKPSAKGFIVPTQAARLMLDSSRSNSDVVTPYLTGSDLYNDIEASPRRYIINFKDWPEERARKYIEPYRYVAERVPLERVGSSEEDNENWWQFGRPGVELYRRIADLPRVIAFAYTSKTLTPVMVPTGITFGDSVVVLPYDDYGTLGLLASGAHYWWAIEYGTTMKNDPRYQVPRCFENFPFPEQTLSLVEVTERLDGSRRDAMRARRTGLTAIYNLVHDASCTDSDIDRLRELHRSLDEHVVASYGWTELIPQLSHDFYDTVQGSRFTVGPVARQEILDLLLELNHERYAAEVGMGLHDKKTKNSTRVTPATASARQPKVDPNQGALDL